MGFTKSDYRKYIQSEAWQKRRKVYLADKFTYNRCGLPRWVAVIAYDQDLHVHHRNYQNVGHELDEDLEPLCRRCHDIDATGKSAFKEPGPELIVDRRVNEWLQSHSEEWLEGYNEAWDWFSYLNVRRQRDDIA